MRVSGWFIIGAAVAVVTSGWRPAVDPALGCGPSGRSVGTLFFLVCKLADDDKMAS